jgi:hypothetical protein
MSRATQRKKLISRYGYGANYPKRKYNYPVLITFETV